MKQTTTVKQVILGIMFASMCFAGCKKELNNQSNMTEAEAAEITLLAQDDAQADQIFTEIHEQELGLMDEFDVPGIGLNSEEAISQDSAGTRCVRMTISPRDPLAFPKTVTVDYGTGCKGRDGKTRKGKMITTYSAPMVRPGATAVTRFENYYVDGVKIEGVHQTKNNSTSNVLIFTRTVENGKMTFPNGGTSVWNAIHTNKQVAGLGTPGFPLDDAFEITGGARGVNERNGRRVEWSRKIETALHKSFRCRWFDKGVVSITCNGNKATLDYGNGICDNKATLTINGNTKEITL
jgi:hypothetical protein